MAKSSIPQWMLYPLTDANYHKVNKRSSSFAPVIDYQQDDIIMFDRCRGWHRKSVRGPTANVHSNYKYGSCPGWMARLLSVHTVLLRTWHGPFQDVVCITIAQPHPEGLHMIVRRRQTWGCDRGGGGIKKQTDEFGCLNTLMNSLNEVISVTLASSWTNASTDKKSLYA